MIIDYAHPSGALEISAIIGNQKYIQKYMGYTKKEAKSLFKQYVAGELAKYIKGKPA